MHRTQPVGKRRCLLRLAEGLGAGPNGTGGWYSIVRLRVWALLACKTEELGFRMLPMRIRASRLGGLVFQISVFLVLGCRVLGFELWGRVCDEGCTWIWI